MTGGLSTHGLGSVFRSPRTGSNLQPGGPAGGGAETLLAEDCLLPRREVPPQGFQGKGPALCPRRSIPYHWVSLCFTVVFSDAVCSLPPTM